MSNRVQNKGKNGAGPRRAAVQSLHKRMAPQDMQMSPAYLQRRLGNQGTARYLQAMMETNAAARNPEANAEPVQAQQEPGSGTEPQEEVKGIQTKLTMGQPGDKYEQEAGTAAARVIAGKPVETLTPIPSQGLPQAMEVQSADQTSNKTDSSLKNRLEVPRAGRPLSPSIQKEMSAKFRTDFSQVRIHDSSQAQADAESIGAKAFTKGNNIWLGRNSSENDRELMAHELAHVVQQRSADAISGQFIQASFISFAVKMGAKRASRGMLKNFIQTRIKSRLKNLMIKKFSKRFSKEADQLLDILEDPWWATAIGFIPIFGDAFDLVRVPKQIKKAIDKANALEGKIKKILSIQGKRAENLIPASMRRNDSYFSELSQKSYAEIIKLSANNPRAAKMKKLIENEHRIMEKL